jgi:hypothetical protein
VTNRKRIKLVEVTVGDERVSVGFGAITGKNRDLFGNLSLIAECAVEILRDVNGLSANSLFCRNREFGFWHQALIRIGLLRTATISGLCS